MIASPARGRVRWHCQQDSPPANGWYFPTGHTSQPPETAPPAPAPPTADAGFVGGGSAAARK
jgi:hypothetical protein